MIGMMKGRLRFATLTVATAVMIGCSHQSDLSRPATQDNFGVQMARMNLWREAMFRFERAIQINPGDAQAHNNLAVAYEANGDFEKARKEYLEALKLDKSNQYIQKNYSRFVEFTSRNKKRQSAQVPKTASSPAQTPSGGAVATRTPPTPPPGMPADPADPNAPPAAGQPSPGPTSPPRTPPPSDLPPPPAKPPGGAL